MKTPLFRHGGFWTLTAVLCAITGFARAESLEERYEVILERKPFGNAAAEAGKAGAKPAASFADTLRLSAIYQLKSESWVGLIDTQSNRSLTLTVGQSDEGVELVSVDLAKDEAVVRKNGETGVLRLESGPSSGVSPSAPLQPGRPAPGGNPQLAVRNPATVAPAADAEQLHNRRQKLLAELRERIERQRAAMAQGNAAPGDGTTRTMVISTPGTSGQVTIHSSGGSTGQVTLQVNGAAVELKE